MKKVLVFFAIFALLGTMVFATDISVGASLEGSFAGNRSAANAKSDDILMNPLGFGFSFSAAKTNDEGTAGAKIGISFDSSSKGDDDRVIGTPHGYAYGFWYPIEQLFFKIGKVGQDGKYWTGLGLLGWDLHSNDLFIHPEFNWYNGFAGGWLGDGHASFSNGVTNGFGFQMSILPIDGFAFNVGFNLGNPGASNTGTPGQLKVPEAYYETIALQAVYDAGIGTAAVGFRNAPKGADKEIAAQWSMGIPDTNMKVQVGGKYLITDSGSKPIDVGIGFGMGSPWGDQFWLNSRVGLRFGGDAKDTIIGVDVVASYDLEIVRVYIPVGFSVKLPNAGDTLVAWNFSPYVKKDLGGINLWTGLVLHNGGVKGQAQVTAANKSDIIWEIPFAFQWEW